MPPLQGLFDDIARGADEFGQNVVGPALELICESAGILAGAAQALVKLLGAHAAEALFKAVLAVQKLMALLKDVDVSEVGDWIEAHSEEATIIGAGLVAACLSPVLMGPLLEGVGFGAVGPIQGESLRPVFPKNAC
jgi:hypothetical protein